MEFQSGAVSPIESIKKGWEIIKDDYWSFFAMTLIAIIILIVASIILGLVNNGITFVISSALGLATQNAGDAGRISAAILPQVISLIISIFTNLIVVTLSGVLFCGIYSALSRKSNSGVTEFGDLFSGFQKISSCFIVAAVLSLIQFVFQLVMILVGAAIGVSAVGLGGLTRGGQINPAVFGGLFLIVLAFLAISIIVNLIISALTSFAYPLIAERGLSGGQALSLSVKGGFANIGGTILLLILLGLMSIGGFLVCIIGILFVAPILSASLFAAYQSVFGRVANAGFQTPPPPPNFGY